MEGIKIGKKASVQDTCYMCDKPATSREHVPPRCFFPETKDMPGTNFRENPITVPSCKEHNHSNSKDDEYAFVCIACSWKSNSIALEHAKTKIVRAMAGSQGLWRQFFGSGNHNLINVDGDDGITVPIDITRFISEMERIARGIYFHEFGRKAPKEVLVYPRSLVTVGASS